MDSSAILVVIARAVLSVAKYCMRIQLILINS